MAGQLVHAPQVAQHDFERHVLAHRDHVEIHERAHGILRIGHRGTQLLALLDGQRPEHVRHDILRQVRHQVGNLVGIELLRRGDQLVAVHVRDERFAHRIGDLQQDVAIAVGLDQFPDDKALVERQRFQDVGDIRRMQPVELVLQFGQVLLVDEGLHQLVPRHVLVVDHVFHDAMLLQQSQNLVEGLLHAFLAFALRGLGHGRNQ